MTGPHTSPVTFHRWPGLLALVVCILLLAMLVALPIRDRWELEYWAALPSAIAVIVGSFLIIGVALLLLMPLLGRLPGVPGRFLLHVHGLNVREHAGQ